MDHNLVIKKIEKGEFESVYFLHGEEPYFIDKITEAISKYALTEEERDFNQTVIYGKDAEIGSLIAEAKGFPMWGERKLVILKEAQSFKDVDKLESYFENPTSSTIFVVNYKYKTFNARSKAIKAAASNGLVYKSEKVRDYQIVDWITKYVRTMGYGITSKAAMLLGEFLGTDLSKICNELDKLAILIEEGTTINDVHIEENIGISKDYNVFELNKAIGVRDIPKAFKIVHYFEQNPKSVNINQLIPTLFSYFANIMRVHFLQNKSREAIAQACRINPFVANELLAASKVYNPKKLAANIAILHEFDLRAKGVNNTASEGELMREMIYRLLH